MERALTPSLSLVLQISIPALRNPCLVLHLSRTWQYRSFQIVSGTTSGAATNLSGGVKINVDFNGAANISAISTGYGVARAGNATSYVVTDASGIATFEGDLSGTVNSSVTAAVEALDEAVITKSDGALFTLAGGAEYLFIQGGSSGTSDDYVLSFNGMSASMISDAGSAFTVTFSGTDS